MAQLALAARYVFPIDAPPLENGVVTIDGQRIVAVGQTTAGPPPVDLGNVALLPGLVNAHTHLEFSDMEHPIGDPRLPLPTWLAAVVAHRRARDPNLPSSVTRGLRELVDCGVTLCGEIARPEWLTAEIEAAPLDAMVFVELIGLAANRIEPLATLANEQLRRAPGGNWRPAISPHAPYSVHPAVVDRVARAASQSAVAMHLAESREELDWLDTGAGPFAEFLESLGVDASEVPRGRPLDYLRYLSLARRSLVIHGNYLDREELEFLAGRADRMTLVYCPRTHAFFGHESYPLATSLAMGIAVAVGTDSRASNPDLNLLAELRFIVRHHPAVPLPRVLELGTIAGARALGYDDCGTLTRGKLANLAAVSLPNAEGDPYELLLASEGACCGSWFRGVPR